MRFETTLFATLPALSQSTFGGGPRSTLSFTKSSSFVEPIAPTDSRRAETERPLRRRDGLQAPLTLGREGEAGKDVLMSELRELLAHLGLGYGSGGPYT